MTGGRLARMEALFHAALEQPAGQRVAFLETQENDPEVRAAVARLLAHHAEGDAALRDALHSAVTDAGAAPARERIGAYRLVRELGAGGMGTVFLAERPIGDTTQRVALKLIRGFPTREAQARLARERTLLAGLNHPNIARLFDGGDSEDGQPYLVMEYVDGEPLLAYCTKRGLGTEARLALIVQLCRAVQHAHQHLVVHRDIKPANVLVRADGTPVLLDFGIGKLIDGTDPDAAATRVFTPAYAAPEQREGRHATTATDVYALGCVLFELLTGASAADASTQTTPVRPSVAVRDAHVARRLRGDLDRIVLKATDRDPARRYASADALAEDVGRYLAGQPVSAGPDSVAYRARKYVARHPFGVAAAALVAAMIGVFVWRLDAERGNALQQATRAAATRDFLVSLFRFADPKVHQGKPPTVRELLDEGSARLGTELAAQPELHAELNDALAEIYGDIGEDEASRKEVESALALAGDGGDPVLRAKRLGRLARIELASREGFADALERTDAALAGIEGRSEEAAREVRSALLNTKGLALTALERYDEASATLRQALELLPTLDENRDEERVTLLQHLVKLDVMSGNNDSALKYAADAEAATIALRGREHPDAIKAIELNASLLARTNHLADAEPRYREVLAAQRKLYGEDSGYVTKTKIALGRVLLREERATDALVFLDDVKARCDRTGADDAHADPQCTLLLKLWGEARAVAGDTATGVAALRRAVAQCAPQSDNDDGICNLTRVSLARVLCLDGQKEEGARLVAGVREPLLAQTYTSPAERAMIERIGRDCAAK
ncbi:MAG TPA: serine/threonine-protein kinase [Rhodanobacteraceae bacterium]|nr:serine/threonine-protein kinase [Rhodanobacteraceae bacterium]